MTDDTQRPEPVIPRAVSPGRVSIGLLSELTGVPVRTIRFYGDEGLLPSSRTTGGHRVFDRSAAVDRLLLVRRLRALGLPLATITGVVNGDQSIADAVAAERATVDRELSELSRRRTSLLSIEQAADAERVTQLQWLAAVQDGPAAHDALVTFWRHVLITMPPTMFEGFVAMNIPLLPPDPTPIQLVAYAELCALVADPRFTMIVTQQLWRDDRVIIRDHSGLLTRIGEAFEQAAALVVAGEAPTAGPVVDHLVGAHARARQLPDTPPLRAALLNAAPTKDPTYQRYWQLAATVADEPAVVAQAHDWLIAGLRHSVEQERG